MLRFETTLESPLAPAQGRAALVTWMQGIGYRIISPPFLTSVQLQRGALSGNFMSFNNVRAWQCRVGVSFRAREGGSDVTLEWLITTAGQTCTRTDVEFWRYEIAQTLGVAIGNTADPDGYRKEARQAQKAATGWAWLLTVALFGPLIGGWAATDSALVGLVAGSVMLGAGFGALRAPRTLGSIEPKRLPPRKM